MHFKRFKIFIAILCLFFVACSKSKRFAATTLSPIEIKANSATFSGKAKNSDNSQIIEVGFCYSADKIPLYADKHVSAINNGTDSFKYTVNDLSANTNYNVRAFAKLKNGSINYGNVLNFSTNNNYQLGDKGPGGGTIFYIDEFNASGKFFEALPLLGNTYSFGCTGNYIGTGMHSGEGKTNSNQIIGICSGNTAASVCLGLKINGLSDWCLPSIEDLEYLQQYYNSRSVTFSDRSFWSSTDYDPDFAYTYNFLYSDYETRDKTEKHEVIAIRYFN